MNKFLIMTIGLPRSGKSTWARKQGFPIVNPDSIRWSLYEQPFIKKMESYVWQFARTMVESLFGAGHSVVILDATSINHAARGVWFDPNQWIIVPRYFDTPYDICSERAKADGLDYLVPVIEKMSLMLKKPDELEFCNMSEKQVPCRCGSSVGWNKISKKEGDYIWRCGVCQTEFIQRS